MGGGAAITPTVRVKLDAQAGADAGGSSEQAVQVAGYGTLTGRVVLDGAKPNLPSPLPAGPLRDPEVCVREKIPNERLIVGEGGGIQNVFVYLARKPAGAKVVAPGAQTVVFDQKSCTYTPHALVVQTGQEIRLVNSDPIAHNVNLKPLSNEPFNSVLKVSDQVGVTYVYRRPEREPARVTCDFHGWMLAWHLPLDHPYGTLTDESGAFTIADLPAGKHDFIIWHGGKRLSQQSVTINPDQTTEAEIKVPAASFASLAPQGGLKTVVVSLSR